MKSKFKDTRQYAGTTFKTMPATQDIDQDTAEEFNESGEMNMSEQIADYENKKKSIELACEFCRLTEGVTMTDILTVAALILSFVTQKNNDEKA